MADVKVRYVGEDDASDEAKKVAGGIKDIESAAGSAKGGVSSFFKDAFSFVTGGIITSALNSVTGSIGGLVSGMVDGNAEFERYEVQFGVLLKSTDAAKQRLADLAKFGASTPFDLPEVVKADKILQGFGLHSEESAAKFGKSGEEIRRIAGDVAAGTGAGFEEMALLIGKLSAGATGEAISRMAELGIASKEELAKMGLEFDKGGALLSPLPQAMQVVTDLMNQKFGGMMDKQSATFEGMTSNFNDWIQGTIRAAGAPVFEKVKAGLGQLLQTLNNPLMKAAIENISNAVGNILGGALGAVIPIIDAFIGVLGTLATKGLEGLFDTFEDGSGAMSDLFQAFGMAEGPAMALSDTLDGVADTVQSVFGTIAEHMDMAANPIGKLAQLIAGLADAFGMGADDSLAFADDIYATLQKILSDVTTVFNMVKDTVSQVFNALVALVSAELGVIVKFFQDHGAEIMADVKKAFDSVVQIITLALMLIQRTIVPLLKAIAKFISDHGTEIGSIFKGAWDVISGVVGVALDLIKGIIGAALALLNGDVSGALGIIAGTFSRVWDGIKQTVQGAWDFISGIVKLAADAIGKLLGFQSQASGITTTFNPNFGQGQPPPAASARGAGSIQMAGDTYSVNTVSVANDIQRARKAATQQALLRATVGV